ncbi:hypothetical protein CFP56_039207 [Quercus suber]|uniref:Uncharacterized protein n=1 Tax=Quercus suber TaxID=58331 RepID=A0AAW0J1C2_QUESU
MGVSNFFQKWI